MQKSVGTCRPILRLGGFFFKYLDRPPYVSAPAKKPSNSGHNGPIFLIEIENQNDRHSICSLRFCICFELNRTAPASCMKNWATTKFVVIFGGSYEFALAKRRASSRRPGFRENRIVGRQTFPLNLIILMGGRCSGRGFCSFLGGERFEFL